MPFYTGKAKCIYIDPPFNTGNAFDFYDDKLEHSQWLSLMYPRLVLLRELLAKEGSVFIHLNDDELDYCKVFMDEVFGRVNFVNRISIEARSPSAFSTVNPGVFKSAEYILWYAKDKNSFSENSVRVQRNPDAAYDKWLVNPDDHYENWKFVSIMEPYSKLKPPRSEKLDSLLKHFYKFIIENARQVCRLASISDSGAGEAIINLKTRSLNSLDKILRLERDGNLDDVYVVNGQQLLFYEKNIAVVDGIKCATSILTNVWKDIAWEGIANEGSVTFKKGKKPERLVKRCFELATNKNDIVIDCFLGSGTTAAVAHKMNRRYIGIEMGEHAKTHCIPRLEKVIAGEQGGISKAVNWAGGGGFSFYTLGEAVFDADGHISQAVRFNALAAYIWLLETKTASSIKTETATTPYLGTHDGIAYYLLYNGILGDRRPNGGNVLTSSILMHLNSVHTHKGKKVVFGEASRLGAAKLATENISFKQIPYELHENIG